MLERDAAGEGTTPTAPRGCMKMCRAAPAAGQWEEGRETQQRTAEARETEASRKGDSAAARTASEARCMYAAAAPRCSA